jgi:hypothetical protein
VAVLSPDAAAAPRGGFFQNRFVQDVLPFLTSLSLHLALLVIGLLAFAAIKVIREPAQPKQVSTAESEMVADGIQALPGLTLDKPWLQTTQDQTATDTSVTGVSFTPGSSIDPSPAGGGSDGDATLAIVGLRAGFGKASAGTNGVGNNPGDGTNGAAAPFGVPQIGGLRGANPVFSPNPARKIAFVCDASGSMINKMPALKVELIKAVQRLKPIQSFSIIFFQDARTPMAMGPALAMATSENKRKAATFLEGVSSIGTTDPIPGIEAAFRQQPELIYLLTDGDFPDNDAVLARITELNKGKKVRVNTIAFVGSGDSDTAFLGLLKKIADQTGGNFRHVKEDELQ